MTILSHDLIWWISAIELPTLAGLFGMVWHNRNAADEAIDHVNTLLERRSEQLRDALNAFKLEVAKTYASQNDLRQVEMRIVEHLVRIEAKLDKTALKAEALKAKSE